MQHWTVQIVIIGFAGCVLGLVTNAVGPRGIALGTPIYAAAESGTGSCDGAAVSEIGCREALAMCDTCDVGFVDARSALAFAQGHIPGAVHLPPRDEHQGEAVLSNLVAHPTLIVYGDATACDQARNVAGRLVDEGHPDVRILAGGWPAWLEREQPSESGACGECPGFEH